MARIERQPDRLAAGKDSREISQAVKQVREIDSTVRVYKKTWMTEGRYPSEAAAQAAFDTKLEGRLHDGDWKVIPSDNGKHFLLKINVWNVTSEWASAEAGEQFIATYLAKDPEAVFEMVTRNSKREHELKAYSINKLPQAKTA